ncbi:uncharacterized protein [Phaenicophaeus curvirostris]|uniref:uncharacterized protein isoform X2 n=1 Tax=Phaenicophaeus curvirostris TaxID=33595 RepID=UPI0037F0BEBA
MAAAELSWPPAAAAGRDNLTEVLAMREPLRDPDPSSGSGGKVMWRCPPGLQLSERYGAFPSLSYTRGGRRGGCPRVKWKRLPFSPKSQSRECPCCRKPGKSLAAQPRFLKAPYSSTFHPVVRSNVRRPCAGTADLLAKPEGPALGVERLGRSHPSSERRRLRMLPERAEDGLQGRENQSEASGQLDSKWGETLMPGEQRSFHC